MAMEGQYFEALGRRKSATARVRLYSGDGNIIVNDKPASDYFTRGVDQQSISAPLVVTGLEKSFDIRHLSNALVIKSKYSLENNHAISF